MGEKEHKFESRIHLGHEDKILLVGALHAAQFEFLLDKHLEPEREDPALTWITTDERHRFIAHPKGGRNKEVYDLISDWRLLRLKMPAAKDNRQLVIYDIVSEGCDISLLVTRHNLLEISPEEVREVNRSAELQHELGMAEPTFQETNELIDGITDLAEEMRLRRTLREAKRQAGYFE